MPKHKKTFAHNGKSALTRLTRTAKRVYYRFIKLRGSPRQISLGLALGVFVGMTPFIGLHTVTAVLLAALFKWSKVAAGIGVLITNPFSAPFIYTLTYKLGAALIGFSNQFQWRDLFEPNGIVDLIRNSPIILVDLIVGGIVMGTPLALIVYYTANPLIAAAQKRLRRRKNRRLSKKRKPCPAEFVR